MNFFALTLGMIDRYTRMNNLKSKGTQWPWLDTSAFVESVYLTEEYYLRRSRYSVTCESVASPFRFGFYALVVVLSYS